MLKEPITVIELFAGIGAFRKAFENLGIPHKVIGISEIDKYAIQSYNAIYGETKNYGDISKIDKLDYADLWSYGFPCQDISVAGLQKGVIKGETRSGLLYEVQRLLEVADEEWELPKYLIMENVKNLVGKKFKPVFDEWLKFLDELGYNNYWQVMDAQDYGLAQHRERVFCISIRKDLEQTFEFPKPVPLEKCMEDYLESEVDEKYYYNDAIIEKYKEITKDNEEKGIGFKFNAVMRDTDSEDGKKKTTSGVCDAVTTKMTRMWCPQIGEKVLIQGYNTITAPNGGEQ